MVRGHRWRGAALVVVLGVLGAPLAACGGNGADTARDERRARVYGAVIRTAVEGTLLEELEDPGDLVVSVWPLAGEPVPLGVQVEALDLLEDFATVRFVDDFEEVLVGDGDGAAIHRGGVAVGLGSLRRDSAPFEVRAVLLEDPDVLEGIVYRVGPVDGGVWSAEEIDRFEPEDPRAAQRPRS